jgi:hypothetical protein
MDRTYSTKPDEGQLGDDYAANQLNWMGDVEGYLTDDGRQIELQTVTGAAGLAIDFNDGSVVQINLGATNSIASVANHVAGRVYRFILLQDGAGSRLLTWAAAFNFAGAALTLTTTANRRDLVCFLSDGVSLYEISRSLDVH